MKFNYKSKKGFTLIELLVVIGILAVLAAIAIPSVAGLIDRANVSADKTNSNEMTNAMERFASEYELFCQDIASGTFDKNNMDSAQGRVYNVLGIEDRAGIELVEIDADEVVNDDAIAIYRDTKYPANAKTAQLIVQNYTKTSSSTFEPKQSDMHYWYSPDCGVIVYAEPDAGLTPENIESKLNVQVVSGMDAKGNPLDENTEWIDLTLTIDNNVYEEPTTLTAVEWQGFTDVYGEDIWTDGTHMYYSSNSTQYILENNTWKPKTWSNLTSFFGKGVWEYNGKYYNSSLDGSYLLNGDTWVKQSWSIGFLGVNVWTDGINMYHSVGYNQHIFKNNDWQRKNWSGLSSIMGDDIWTDGTNIYYSSGTEQYVLDGNSWKSTTWNNLTNFYGNNVWSDGHNIYYSEGTKQYVLKNNTWEEKNWNSPVQIIGSKVWTDGKNYYYSNGTEQYKIS